jgi:MoaA/NifB/PqqE/SkfB family radical SAM enzyme
VPRSKNPIVLRIYVTKKCELHCGYCINGGMQPYYTPPSVDARYEDVRRFIDECPGLGIKYVEFAGGDPLLWRSLSEILIYCKKNKPQISTSLPVSGIGLTNSFKVIEPGWLPYPDLLRISVHYDSKGIVSFENLCKGLDIVKKYRPKGETQLGVILIPGEEGNLREELLELILAVAEKFSHLIHISTVLGTWRNGNWNKYKGLWKNVSDNDRGVLKWFVQQPNVLPLNAEKVERCLSGGHDRDNPTCQAGISVMTVRNNRLIDPCAINPCLCEDIKGSLEDAIRSEERMSCEKPGTYYYCNSCTYDCSDVSGSLFNHSDFASYCAM